MVVVVGSGARARVLWCGVVCYKRQTVRKGSRPNPKPPPMVVVVVVVVVWVLCGVVQWSTTMTT